MKSAGESANLGTGKFQVKSATESAKPSEDAAKVKSPTADAGTITAPNAMSGEDQTELPDTVRVKSAEGSARTGTDKVPVRGARASASPSKGVARARCAAGGARPGKGKGQVKSAKESATLGEFRFQYYRNPSRGFYDPVNAKRWSCSYDRYTVKKKKREERHRERHREHVRRKREDAHHAARTVSTISRSSLALS